MIKGGDSMKPIGIVYRYGYNDYEIQLMDFNKNDTETLLTIPMKYGDESSGLRGDRDLSLADANVDYWEKDWGTEELAREIFEKVYDPWTEDERVCRIS